jgi:hypothetical protein
MLTRIQVLNLLEQEREYIRRNGISVIPKSGDRAWGRTISRLPILSTLNLANNAACSSPH